MVPYPYNPAVHRIQKSGSLADWVKREFPRFDLVLIGNAITQRWSIAEWQQKKTYLEDIVSFDNPHTFTPELAEKARYILCGPAVSVKEVLDGVEKSNMDKLLEMQHESRRARAYSAAKSGTGDLLGIPCR